MTTVVETTRVSPEEIAGTVAKARSLVTAYLEERPDERLIGPGDLPWALQELILLAAAEVDPDCTSDEVDVAFNEIYDAAQAILEARGGDYLQTVNLEIDLELDADALALLERVREVRARFLTAIPADHGLSRTIVAMLAQQYNVDGSGAHRDAGTPGELAFGRAAAAAIANWASWRATHSDVALTSDAGEAALFAAEAAGRAVLGTADLVAIAALPGLLDRPFDAGSPTLRGSLLDIVGLEIRERILRDEQQQALEA